MSTQQDQNLWLEKATMATSDLTGGTDGGLLSPAQAAAFIRVAIDATVLLKDARVETSKAPTWEVPRLSVANRIMRGGTEGTRLDAGDRIIPTTGLASLTTVLLRGEVPISDEVFEDNIERDKMADTIMTMVAEAVGRDVEELLIQGDTDRIASEDTYLDLLDGLIKQCQDDVTAGQKVNVASLSTYDEMLSGMIEALPARYRKDISKLRFYLPVLHNDKYIASLGDRGTALGDRALIENIKTSLAYRGIKTVEIPILTGTDFINNAAVDYDTFGLLADPKNFIVGWQRKIRIEKWRDPREGATSFVPSCRVDITLAEPNAMVFAYGIPTTLT